MASRNLLVHGLNHARDQFNKEGSAFILNTNKGRPDLVGLALLDVRPARRSSNRIVERVARGERVSDLTDSRRTSYTATHPRYFKDKALEATNC